MTDVSWLRMANISLQVIQIGSVSDHCSWFLNTPTTALPLHHLQIFTFIFILSTIVTKLAFLNSFSSFLNNIQSTVI